MVFFIWANLKTTFQNLIWTNLSVVVYVGALKMYYGEHTVNTHFARAKTFGVQWFDRSYLYCAYGVCIFSYISLRCIFHALVQRVIKIEATN